MSPDLKVGTFFWRNFGNPPWEHAILDVFFTGFPWVVFNVPGCVEKYMIRSYPEKKSFRKKMDEIFGHLNIFSSLYKKHRKKWKFFRKKSIFRDFFFDCFFRKIDFFSEKFSLFPMFFIKGWKNLQVKKNMVEKKFRRKISLGNNFESSTFQRTRAH